jgi:hypothetical protein
MPLFFGSIEPRIWTTYTIVCRSRNTGYYSSLLYYVYNTNITHNVARM